MNTLQNIKIMKFIKSTLLIGLIVVSCKKEQKIERTVTTDSIIADTIKTDTTIVAPPAPVPVPADTLRTDSTSSKKRQDTAKTKKTRSK